MEIDSDIGHTTRGKAPRKVRKAGRPRIIPPEFEPVVIELYGIGYGYRAIVRILRNDYHISPDFSTIKRTLKRLGILLHAGSPSKFPPD